MVGSFLPFVASLAVFATPIFFSISELTGFYYPGVAESPIFVFYIALTFALVLIFFISSLRKESFLTTAEISFYLFFLLLLSNHFIWLGFNDAGTKALPDNLITFLGMGVTGFMAARIVRAYGIWLQIIRFTEVVILLISIGLISGFISSLFSGSRALGVGGANYQTASYMAAMCYGMVGLSALRLPKIYRYRIFRGGPMLLVSIIIMTVLFAVVINNGGRGAFVLLLVYSGLMILWLIRKDWGARGAVLKFLLVLTVGPIIIASSHIIPNLQYLVAGWRRATSFIRSPQRGLIDLEDGSSGRDQIYIRSINAIEESPLIGYGAFGSWDKIGQPHNIFLDLATQLGPIIAISLTIFVSTALYSRVTIQRELPVCQLWILVLFLYPLVQLMFSSGYLRSSIFWFCLSSVFFLRCSRQSCSPHPEPGR